MSFVKGTRFVLATSLASRARGLLGTNRDWGQGRSVLVLAPCRSIHTLCMRYPIDVAFVDARGTVVRSARSASQLCARAPRRTAAVLAGSGQQRATRLP